VEHVVEITETEPKERTIAWREYTLSCRPIDPVHPDVLDLAEKENDKLTFFHVSGPAIKAVHFTLPVIFGFVLLFPVLAWKVSHCPTPGHMYAYCPNWLVVLFVPLFLLMTWCEWNCFRIMVVPYVQWLAPFDILGFKVSLQEWLPYTFMMSSAAKLDIFTNSIFVAKIFATFKCKGSLWATAQTAWEVAIATSSVAHVPLVNQLIFCCFLGWIIIVVQLVFAFLMSHPWKGVGKTDYNWQGERNGYSTLWTRLFDTCHETRTMIWHADVVRILAPAIRNLTAMSQSCNWQMERVRKHLKLRGTSHTNLQEQRRCFDMLFKESERMVLSLWLFTIFERAIVMETQTSMYALIQAVNKERDLQIYLTLFVSFMSLIKALVDAGCQARNLLRTHRQVIEQIQSLEEQPPYEPENDFTTCIEKFKTWLMRLPGPGDLPTQAGVLLEARRAKMIIVVGMVFGTVALLLILSHAFAKLVMVENCVYGFWNVPLDSASLRRGGCVDLSHVEAIVKARGEN